MKDKLSVEQESSVVYKVPCTCGSYYIGEKVRRLETRLREHKDACKRGETEKSAVAEHAWTEEHPILWDQTKVIDRANRQEIQGGFAYPDFKWPFQRTDIPVLACVIKPELLNFTSPSN